MMAEEMPVADFMISESAISGDMAACISNSVAISGSMATSLVPPLPEILITAPEWLNSSHKVLNGISKLVLAME